MIAGLKRWISRQIHLLHLMIVKTRKSRMLMLGHLMTLAGAIQAHGDLLPPVFGSKYTGYILLILGITVSYLRADTTLPLDQK